MRILFFEWESYGKGYVLRALEQLGHEVKRVKFDYDENNNIEYEKKVKKLLSYQCYDAVFTLNYFAVIANACHTNKTPYISWIYDSPLMQVWNESAFYEENTIFCFDQGLCDTLRKRGVKRIFYMPLAADTDYIETVELKSEEIERFTSVVSFVGNFYDKKTDIEEALEANGMYFLQGYSDAVMEAQSEISGYNFLEELTEPADIKNKIEAFMVQNEKEKTFAPLHINYANYYLAKETTKRERRRIIEVVAERFPTDVYTTSDVSMISKIVNKGPVNYYTAMPLVFKYSKINLNITLKSIKTGIPLRALDIMAAGGFLLTNYQEDMLKHFEPGVDFVYYLNQEDLLKKIEYYLSHEEERKQIAQNGFEKIKKYHSYKMTMEKMFKFALEGEKDDNYFL